PSPARHTWTYGGSPMRPFARTLVAVSGTVLLLAGTASARPTNPDDRQPPPGRHAWNREWNCYETSDNGSFRQLRVWPTTPNGLMDDDDTLYSLVDLRQFLLNPPDFDPLQHFQLVNGHSDALPGMRFSTTPFTFSEQSGWSDGTPFSGDSVELSYHEMVVPAP